MIWRTKYNNVYYICVPANQRVFKQVIKSPLWHILSLSRFDLLLFRPFHKIFSFEEKSKKDLRRSPDQFEREQTECDKLLLLAPLHFGERATCQRVRPTMRSRQGSNSSRMCFATTLGWETWKLFKNLLCIKTRLGTWQLFRRREPPLSSCHEHWGRGWNSAGSFTLCLFWKFEMGTEGTYSCSCKEKENYFFKKV